MSKYFDKKYKVEILVSQVDVERILLKMPDDECVAVILEVFANNPGIEKMLLERLEEYGD